MKGYHNYHTVAPQLEYLPVPVSEFGVHVNQLHVNKNRLFEEQFEVCSSS